MKIYKIIYIFYMFDAINANMIGNLIASYTTEKYDLNQKYSVAITTLVSSFLMFINTEYILQYKYFLLLIIPFFFWYSKTPKQNIENVEYSYFKTFHANHAYLFNWLIKTHPEFFDKNINWTYNNPDMYSNNCTAFADYYLPDESQKVFFNDTIRETKGYIVLECTTKAINENGKKVEEKSYFLNIYIEKTSKYTPPEYIKIITDYENEIRKNKNTMELFLARIIKPNTEDDSDHQISIYNGPKNNNEERYEKYMKSYFSPLRDRLWNYISNVHFNPEKFSKFGQESHCNLLLYGPPGTGKSTFAYRIAMALGRHIVSVDITSISHNRQQVYQIIQAPYINGRIEQPNNYIVLLEEFDITIKYLTSNSKKKTDFDFTSLFFKKEDSEENKEEKSYSHLRMEREFEIGDLLEILQGPVPIKGSIIIATTNKYEEIKELCPALFRPGRLTPVKFDYMDWNSLQDMTQFYFNKKLSLEPKKLEIPTSDIVELALDCSLYENSFDRFENNIKRRLENDSNSTLTSFMNN